MCAVVAMTNAPREPQSARQMGKASLVLSVIGLIVGIICIVIIALFQVFGAKQASDTDDRYGSGYRYHDD